MDLTEASSAEPSPDLSASAVPSSAATKLSSHGLKARLFQGAAAEIAGFGTAQVLRLASNLVLTRLLFPEAFGLMAMLGLVLYGLIMLTDVGFTPAVIRSPRGDDPLFLDTVYTLKATRALGIWIVASLLAWPVSLLFREHSLLYMIPAGSAGTFILGLHSMRLISLRRHLRVVPCVLVELGGQAVTIGVSITLAWAGLGVWSLVIGQLVSAVLYTSATYFLPGTHRDRFRVDPAAQHEIIQFGRWIFASSAVSLAAGRGDQFVLGRLLGAAALGVYNIALSLADLPETLVARLIEGMVYPLLSRVHNQRPADLPRVYFRTRLLLDGVMHTGLGGLIALSPWLIHLLYDERYHGAAPMLGVVAIRASLTVLAGPCESALFACGLSQYAFRRNLLVAIASFVFMPIGNHLAGPMGLLWGTVLARAMAFVILWPPARRLGLFRLHRELLFIPMIATGYGLGRLLLLVLPWR